MRGALGHESDLQGSRGIIPADAGSTPGASPGPADRQDHPRGCGEHASSRVFGSFSIGSSPRMRGARPRPYPPCHGRGIIPADAGSTSRSAAQRPREGDHPADAGSTLLGVCHTDEDEDHPRGCGEHPYRSPRRSLMRGALSRNSVQGAPVRIIPADAGSTTAPRRRAHPGGDHPRGCGEHVDGLRAGPGGAGSSPRMRGALPCCKTRRPARGIIPADAGSTQVAQYKDVADRDHPRGCGEHSSRAKLHACDMGSSPRMRGARSRDYDQRSGSGIIPADAGSTI